MTAAIQLFAQGGLLIVPIIILVIAAVIASIVYASIKERKRREAFQLLATELGFYYSAAKDYEFPNRYGFLNKLAQGSNRYAYNMLTGSTDQGETAIIMDYHFETHSSDSKGNRQTQHHRFSFFVLLMPTHFPELTVMREGFFSKIAQAVGYDDIDFESHEFSRKYCVRSRNKKFAYDVCNARMIDYLLDNRDLTMEIEGPALAIGFKSRLSVDQIRGQYGRLLQIRSLIPNYLFE